MTWSERFGFVLPFLAILGFMVIMARGFMQIETQERVCINAGYAGTISFEGIWFCIGANSEGDYSVEPVEEVRARVQKD